MIHEFAVDPAALSTWQAFRYLVEKFGIDQGRLISRFPSRWQKLVYDATATCGEIERKRIEVELESIVTKLVRNGRSYEPSLSWLDNAESSHLERPFRAVIAATNPNGREFVRVAAEMSEADPSFHVPRGMCIPRTAEAMLAAAAPLLSLSNEILFVDPRFGPSEKRYKRPLGQFLAAISERSRRPDRLEIHLKHDPPRSAGLDEFREHIPALIPEGLRVTVRAWSTVKGGEAMHARYILSELGGIRVDHGLDEGHRGQSVDVELLSPEIHKSRWADFQPDTQRYSQAWVVTLP